ncbi:acyltransferase family protein [Georgenia sp. Z1344]|uniref:acyltransferase family protein n=1 Tax=Georgenia sp. Z1344 TaxID=3416706 RepID=UPI003CF89A89
MAIGGRIRGLDGLRALGCALVLVYHLLPGLAPAGNVGVDVFFVVSGFLITTLLVREIGRTGSVDVPGFVVRRVRRLAPAVVTCALAVTALAALVGGDVLVRIGRQLVGTLTFTANWFQVADGQSYFDQQTPALLTHAWSLGVEQQFYLVWPLALLLVWKAPRGIRPWLALTIGAASVALAAGLGGSRAYLGTDTHLYGLMLGAALALALAPGRPRSRDGLWYPAGHPARRSAEGTVGPVQAAVRGGAGWAALLALVVLAVVGSAASDLATPWLLLAASVLAALVVQAMTPAVLEQPAGRTLVRVLELPPVVWLGERSYSIYLWHWPLLVLAQAQWPYADPRLVAAGVLAGTVLAAEASYRWVETPVRRLGVRGAAASLRRRSLTLGVPVVAASAVVLTGTAWAVDQAPDRTSTEELFASGPGTGGVRTYPAPGESDETGDAGGSDAGETPDDGAGDGSAGADEHGPTGEPGGAEDPAGENPSAEGEPGTTGTSPDDDEPPSGESRSEQGEPGQGGREGGESASGESPSGDGAPSAGSGVAGADVSVVGDSVTLASGPAIGEALPGVTVDAEVSRSFGSEVGIVEQMARAGTLADHVVVAGATNGTVRESEIDQLVEAAGDRCVVLVTGYGQDSATWIPEANGAIHESAERHESVVVADWHAAVEDDPELVGQDHIHPGNDGARQYAATVDQALGSCPS